MARILIGVMSCQSYAERRQRCLESWIPEALALGMDVVFLIGGHSGVTSRNGLILNLPCRDDYSSLPQKTCQFVQWAIDHSDCDYVFKCDDDTYLRPDRLAAMDLSGHDYIGAEWSQGVNYGSGGAGYFLSRHAMTIVADAMIVHMEGIEDLLVGQCMANAGVRLHVDPRFIPFGNPERRPKRNNDIISTHACDAPWKAHASEFCNQRPVVSCNPSGRLGNNMFQVAAALGYAMKYLQHDPVFTAGAFGQYGSSMFSRLRYSEIPREFMTVGDAADFAFNDQIPEFPDCSVIFEGYMQSEKYFAHCKDLIRQTFAIPPFVKARLYGRFRTELQAGAVSMHVRRGDYLKKPDFHPVQSVEYYLNAIQYLTDRVSAPFVLCVSDDLDWCRQNLAPHDGRITIVDAQSDYDDLALMSLCQHHIISNSTFSWWGAWLGSNPKKMVVAPGIFWGPAFAGYSHRDLIPDGWITLRDDQLAPGGSAECSKQGLDNLIEYRVKTLELEFPETSPAEFPHGITMAQIRRLVACDDPVVLELGCNDGGDTARFLEEFPGITIHCFEPDPRPVQRFSIKDSRCYLHRSAIGENDGSVLFHMSGGSPSNEAQRAWDRSSSIRPPTAHLEIHPWCTFDQKMIVPVRSLDSWYSEYLSPGEIDFIWADIQGAEGDLISGGRQTLCNHTRYLYTECYEIPMYEGQATRQQILQQLPEFECIGIYEGYNILLKNRKLCSQR